MDTISTMTPTLNVRGASYAPTQAGEVRPQPPGNAQDAEGPPSTGGTVHELDIRRSFQRMLSEKEAVNQIAHDVRQVAEGRKLADRAREELETVVKSFPPFPAGSAEREQYLMSVAGIRSIIEQLTMTNEERGRFDDVLGQPALINADLPEKALAEAIPGLERVGKMLSQMGEVLEKSINEDLPQPGGDDVYVGQSHDIGLSLVGSTTGITQGSESILRMIG